MRRAPQLLVLISWFCLTALASAQSDGPAPIITAQPDSLAVVAGATATFSVTATPNPAFQWEFNGQPLADGGGISGSQTSKLTIRNAQPANDGVYTVLATDKMASTTSAPAVLAVSDQPLPAQPAGIPATIYNITSYQAVGDGATDNTAAIQSAINAARDGGGGVVLAPPGVFLSNSLTLYGKINFQIAAGATLRLLPLSSFPARGTGTPMISATNATDIQISGHGTIDGQGAAWWAAFRGAGNGLSRPYLIRFNGCSRLLVQDITLMDSPMFHVAFSGNGSNITALGLTVSASATSPNTDGIDPSGKNIYIAHCNISVGDDNIAIKGRSVACGNIVVTNCAFGAGHGLSIGGQTNAGVDGMVATNCTFNGTTSGIRMKADPTQGGLTQNITYANMTMTNVQYPIVIYSYYNKVGNPGVASGGNYITPARAARDNTTPPNSLDSRTIPVWRNITFRNLTSTGARGYNVIWGLPGYLVENVTFDHVQMSGDYGFEIYDATNVQFIGNSSVTATKSNPFIVGYPEGDQDASDVTNSLAITTQPASQIVKAGSAAELTVTVAASPAATCQWFKNGAAIPGATETKLKFPNIQPSDAANYTVTVSNAAGNATSSAATLTVQ